jgi:hypothetical protein
MFYLQTNPQSAVNAGSKKPAKHAPTTRLSKKEMTIVPTATEAQELAISYAINLATRGTPCTNVEHQILEILLKLMHLSEATSATTENADSSSEISIGKVKIYGQKTELDAIALMTQLMHLCNQSDELDAIDFGNGFIMRGSHKEIEAIRKDKRERKHPGNEFTVGSVKIIIDE